MDKIDLIQRIENYLAAGGLNNPELMDHERVRDLIIDCRDALAHPNPAAQHWHDLYKAKCQDLHDRQAMLGAEIVALEEELEELKEEQIEPAFKLSDAGADTNISRGLEPKGLGMVALHQPGPIGKIPTLAEMKKLLNGEPIELAERESAPVGITSKEHDGGCALFDDVILPDKTFLYTAPPRKPWVGLTDEEIDSCFEDYGWSSSAMYHMVVHGLEAKLKERNR